MLSFCGCDGQRLVTFCPNRKKVALGKGVTAYTLSLMSDFGILCSTTGWENDEGAVRITNHQTYNRVKNNGSTSPVQIDTTYANAYTNVRNCLGVVWFRLSPIVSFWLREYLHISPRYLQFKTFNHFYALTYSRSKNVVYFPSRYV